MKQAGEATVNAAGQGTAAAPPDLPVTGQFDGLFGGLGVRSRMVLSQLPLTVTVVLVVVAAAVFNPSALDNRQFQLALLAHAALFAACLALPWNRLRTEAFAVIAVLDCLAIGFTREAGGPPFNVMSLLLVFPVVWLAAQPRRYMVVLAILGTVLSTVVPSIVAGSPPTSASMIRTIFLPLILSAVAVTAHLVAGTIRRQRQRLVDKENALEVALAESVRKQRLLDAVLGPLASVSGWWTGTVEPS
ncbi:hypothetical protein [Arthrobacter sp. SD76]|uniref:hypothetical protein n=1 Tax=Arthrobacter sp. SD76 TaxID=3415007 RepID=UPI003C746414